MTDFPWRQPSLQQNFGQSLITIFKDSHHFSKTFGSLWWQSFKTAITSAELWAVFDASLWWQPSLQQNFGQCLMAMLNDNAFVERTLRGRFREKNTLYQLFTSSVGLSGRVSSEVSSDILAGLAPRFVMECSITMWAYNPRSFVSATLSFTVYLSTHEILHSYSYFCFKYHIWIYVCICLCLIV